MADRNKFSGQGTVSSRQSGRTGDGAAAFSCMLRMQGERGPSWVRVNAYGELAEFCDQNVEDGDRIRVDGEVMNRRQVQTALALCEIRCQDVAKILVDS